MRSLQFSGPNNPDDGTQRLTGQGGRKEEALSVPGDRNSSSFFSDTFALTGVGPVKFGAVAIRLEVRARGGPPTKSRDDLRGTKAPTPPLSLHLFSAPLGSLSLTLCSSALPCLRLCPFHFLTGTRVGKKRLPDEKRGRGGACVEGKVETRGQAAVRQSADARRPR